MISERDANNPPIVVVVAMGRNTRVIGRDNKLIWHVPEDLKRFAAKTRGHPVIMGRKTFESIVVLLGHPLPKRPNIVISRNKAYTYDGVRVVDSLKAALDHAARLDPEEIHIGGGEQIYRDVMPLVDRLYVTLFDDDAPGDAHFPEYESEFTETERHGVREHDGLRYEWVDYVRRDT